MTDSSYHVLWKTTQRTPTASDGPVIFTTFDADSSIAYDDTGADDYPSQTVGVFGEWERLPVGGVFLEIGEDFQAQMILTEEFFHGSGGEYAGGWAAAMGAEIPAQPHPEMGVVSGVNNSQWATVNLSRAYASMVAVCSPNYDKTVPPLVVRVQNAEGRSFQIKETMPTGTAIPWSSGR